MYAKYLFVSSYVCHNNHDSFDKIVIPNFGKSTFPFKFFTELNGL